MRREYKLANINNLTCHVYRIILYNIVIARIFTIYVRMFVCVCRACMHVYPRVYVYVCMYMLYYIVTGESASKSRAEIKSRRAELQYTIKSIIRRSCNSSDCVKTQARIYAHPLHFYS